MEDIKRGAELVNSVLLARGYQFEKLLFPSVDEIAEPLDNDKAVINTTYALLQELDKCNNERRYLQDVLTDKNEIIKHFEASNTELNAQNAVLCRELNSQKNEAEVLRSQVKSLRLGMRDSEKILLKQRSIAQAIKTKYDVDIKRKNVSIEKLQDKLLSKRRKFLSVIQSNHVHEQVAAIDTKLYLDQEMESMMQNLSDLIQNLTGQNSRCVQLVHFIVEYLKVLIQHQRAKVNGISELSPPTAQYFQARLEQIQGSVDELEPQVMEQLQQLYDTVAMEPVDEKQPARVIQLQQLAEQLQRDLDAALETNEEWKRRSK